MPQDEQDKENPDKYLVYSEIDDVYQITKDKSINQSEKSKETYVLNIEPNSKFLVNQNITKDWKLETKKDYPLQLVIDIVKAGKLPNQDERKQLPPLTNLYFNWFNFLFVKDELLYLQRPVKEGKTSPPRICVPHSMQRESVELAHAGHRGITETLDKLRVRAFSPGMNTLVTLIVTNCVPCIQKKVYLDTVGP